MCSREYDAPTVNDPIDNNIIRIFILSLLKKKHQYSIPNAITVKGKQINSMSYSVCTSVYGRQAKSLDTKLLTDITLS